MGVNFSESATKSIWQEKVLRIHSEVQVCKNIRLVWFLVKSEGLSKTQFSKFA